MKKKKQKKKERKKERKKRNERKEKNNSTVVPTLLCRMQSVVDRMDSQRRETRQEDCLIGPMRRKIPRFVEAGEQ